MCKILINITVIKPDCRKTKENKMYENQIIGRNIKNP